MKDKLSSKRCFIVLCRGCVMVWSRSFSIVLSSTGRSVVLCCVGML